MLQINIFSILLQAYCIFKLIQYAVFEIKEQKNKTGGMIIIILALLILPTYFIIMYF